MPWWITSGRTCARPFCNELELALYDAAERLLLPSHRTRRAPGIDRGSRDACHQGLCRQPARAAGAAAAGRADGARAGPGLPHRHQGGGGGATGKLLDTATIYPHEPQNQWKEAWKHCRR